ncbi:MAG: polysaccharide deacetylase family protein [Chloroflexota bacterium]|nr:MAG: polysaccharide deacetylase family protein [Chloroflexota bacterium]
MNLQSPILPFPTLLWEQIAALQSHNRFLYTGNRYLREIALTFDDGPNPYYTPQVLAVLQRYGVKASFFCIGRQVASYPDLVKQEYADGNLVGNHSWSHPNLALLSSDEIDSQINLTSNAIQQVIGVRPTLFRPPYGVVNARVLSKANLLGLTTIIWSDEARDWTTPGTSVIVSRILSLAGDGAIILMHDGGGDRSQTVAALPAIITTLRLRGYQFVTLQQMLKDLPKRPASTQAPIFVPTTIPSASPAASPGP